ncbi:MAG TPA: helix-turn-helix domain-containing protein, partial [Phenylobacterium sp.]|nr:helix-turn-helix domain-containing protein [Phenylobacterium sp.]
LKLHPKTVLRFIHEGRVRAVKVGKSYRILRTEMEAMTGVTLGAYRVAHDTGGATLEPREGPSGIRVTSIVDLPNIGAETAQRLGRVLPAARMGREGHPDPMNLDVIYDPATRILKVLIVGSPIDTATMLKMVQVLSES